MTRTIPSLLVATLVLLAGCAAGSGLVAPTDPGSGAPTDPTGEESTGTIEFYVSDEPNAIDEFRHLNVTIDRVVLIRSDDTDENETAQRPTDTTTETTNGTPSAPEAQSAGADDESDDGRLVVDVDDRTVDLTRLVGNNATLIGTFDVPDGTYTKVFVHVSDVNATLETGGAANVKLPSGKLHITERFTVNANESVDFVFDIGVHEAGKSGKYILHPVVSESGTDVPIDPIDDPDDRDEDDLERAEDRDLNLSVVGTVTSGGTATVRVTWNGSPVSNATIVVNGDAVGTTGVEGLVSFAVPSDASELEIEVDARDAEGELEIEVGATADEPGTDDREGEDRRTERGPDREAAEEDESLHVALVGNATAGDTETVEVTRNGSPVANATVSIDGEVVGTTGPTGNVTFVVPEGADELSVDVVSGDAEGELEIELEDSDGDDAGPAESTRVDQ